MKEKTFFGFDVTPRGVYRKEISRLRDEVEYQQKRADMLYSRNLDMNDKLKRAMETIHRLEAKLVRRMIESEISKGDLRNRRKVSKPIAR